MSCKVKFGVSFNPNMSLEDIARFWCKRVTQETKDKYPQVNQTMLGIQTAISTYKTARDTYKTYLDTYRDVQIAIAGGSAAIAGQAGAWIAAKSALAAQTGVAAAAESALSQAEASIQLSMQCPPDESEDIPENEQSPTDKEIAQALNTIFNTDPCDF